MVLVVWSIVTMAPSADLLALHLSGPSVGGRQDMM